MAQPKEARTLPVISVRAIRNLQEGESCIVSAASPSAVSAEFARTPGKFVQHVVYVIDKRTGECRQMYAVTRIPPLPKGK